MEVHDITIAYKARYCTLGTLNANTRKVWFVLHGYGQLATYFIRKFNVLEAQGIVVIAPEGLSRFYVDNLQPTGRASDRVGATWMTKENRLTDIENYLSYLDATFQQTIGTRTDVDVTVLGFSQGAATASRWIAHGNVRFNKLILWAGVFPPDMDFDRAGHILHDKQTYFVYGTADPFINDARFAEQTTLAQKLGITPSVISFGGRHELHDATLLRLA